MKGEVKIVYEDDGLVVIDKPAGMVTNESRTALDNTVQGWFRKKFSIFDVKYFGEDGEFYQKGGVVHRLDKETSGLLVLAKNPQAYISLKNQFLERKVQKKYIAMVHGVINPEKGMVSLPIERHSKVWGKFAVGKDLARTAITEWETKEKFDRGFSLLEIRPMTGRTHQIRVHMKYLQHPVVSDPLYLGRKMYLSDEKWCPRLFLHATELRLLHPISQETCVFASPLPEDLVIAREKLIHWESE